MRITGAATDRLRIKSIDLAARGSEDALKWHKANIPTLTQAQIEAFEAGYRQGFREGISAAILDLSD